jgi:hypothetical protein
VPVAIPPREPIADVFNGVLLEAEGQHLLAEQVVPGAAVIASGPLIIRYGARFLGKLHISIVPGLIALDYGAFLTGEEAWSFLTEKSNRFPRSEVIGYRNDGVDDMVTIKTLDMVPPPMVLAYDSASATKPLASVDALIAPENLPADIPPRLATSVPRYSTLADWQAAHTHG